MILKIKNFFLGKRNQMVVLSNLVKLILIIAINRLLTQYLEFEEISKYYLIISTYSFFSLIFIAPFGEYINKHLINIYTINVLYKYIESYHFKILSLISFLILFIISPIIYLKFGANENLFFIPLLIICFVIFKTIFDGNISYLNGTGNYHSYVIYNGLINFFILIFTYLSITIFDSNYIFWALGYVLAYGILSIQTIFSIRHISNSIGELKIFSFNRGSINFFKTLFIGNIFFWIITDGIRFFAESKFGLAKAGIILLGFSISSQVFSVATNFLAPLFSPQLLESFSKNEKKDRIKGINSYSIKNIALYILIFSISFYFSEFLIKILIDKSKIVENLLEIVRIGLSIELIKSLITLAKQYCISEDKLNSFTFITFIPVLIFIGCFFIDFEFNIMSFIYMVLFSYVAYLVFILINTSKIIKY